MAIAEHPPITVGVLGPGSLGLLFGVSLAAAGAPVWLIGRAGGTPGERRVILERDAGPCAQTLPYYPVDAVPGGLTHVLHCTKAYDAEPAIRRLAPSLADGAAVLTLQNGLGSQDAVAAALPSHPVYAACTTEGAWRRNAGTVVHAGRGITRIGPLQGGGIDWCGLLEPAGLACEAVDDIRSWLADKLRVNALLNPLTVLHDCRNGGLLEIPEAQAAMQRLGAEADAVLAAAGYRLTGSAAERTDAVARTTAANVSSMLQDRRAGRCLELDAITGHIIALGERHGVPTPEHRAVYQALRGLGELKGWTSAGGDCGD